MKIKVGDLLKFYLPFYKDIENNIEHWCLVLFIDKENIYLSPISSEKEQINLENKREMKKQIKYPNFDTISIKKENGTNFKIDFFFNEKNIEKNYLKIKIKNEYPLIFPWNNSYLYFKDISKITNNNFLNKLLYKQNFIKNNEKLKNIIKPFLSKFEKEINILNFEKIIKFNLCKLTNTNLTNRVRLKIKEWENQKLYFKNKKNKFNIKNLNLNKI